MLKDRLEELMAEYGIENKQQLAKFAGVSKALVGQWFLGETGLGAKPLLAFDTKTRFSTKWLATGEGEKYKVQDTLKQHEISDIHKPRLWSSNDPLPEDEYVFTPFLKEVEFTGGDGSFESSDYNGFRLPFGKSTLYRKGIQPENVVCCTLNGDSMEPFIHEDSVIGIDQGETMIRDGKIYAFQHDDLFRVKYLSRMPNGKVCIRSANSEYKDEIVDGEAIRVIGRVFWSSSLY